MTPEQLDEIEKLAEAATPGPWVAEKDAAFIAAMRKYALPLVKALREARKALDEREGDMHDRIRAGYDKTVADMWRAHSAKIEQERDEARAEVEMLRGVGCGELREGAEVEDGPCGVCLKCARRERDEARAESARLQAQVEWLLEGREQQEQRLALEVDE